MSTCFSGRLPWYTSTGILEELYILKFLGGIIENREPHNRYYRLAIASVEIRFLLKLCTWIMMKMCFITLSPCMNRNFVRVPNLCSDWIVDYESMEKFCIQYNITPNVTPSLDPEFSFSPHWQSRNSVQGGAALLLDPVARTLRVSDMCERTVRS
jgi:hypothetical protein